MKTHLNKTETQVVEDRIKFHNNFISAQMKLKREQRNHRDIAESKTAVSNLNKMLGRTGLPKTKEITGAVKQSYITLHETHI